MPEPPVSKDKPSRIGRLVLLVVALGCGFAILVLAQRSATRERDGRTLELQHQIEGLRQDLNDVTQEIEVRKNAETQRQAEE